jgi:flagellar hook protein FlgE
MSFTTALSGLNAAANNLAVTGNNIANANTVGFKKSRSEFADVYSSSFGGVSSITPGVGVRVANVAQQFGQGNIDFTENSLDLAVAGEGFFVLGQDVANTASHVYTRAGTFHLDSTGNVVNNEGRPLLVQYTDPTTNQQNVQALNLTSTSGAPKTTTKVSMQANLNATAANPGSGGVPPVFSPTDSNSYNFATSTTVYDSLGNPHIATSYFVANRSSASPNAWKMFTYLDNTAIDAIPAPTTPPPPTAAMATYTTATATFNTAATTYTTAAATFAASAQSAADMSTYAAATATYATALAAYETATTSYAASSPANAGAAATFTAATTAYNTAKAAYDAATVTYNASSQSAADIAAYDAAATTYNTAATTYATAAAAYGTTSTTANNALATAWAPAGRDLDFSPTGSLVTSASATLPPVVITGAAPLTLTYDLTGTTQYGSPTGINALSQDGNAAGQLTGIDVSKSGVVTARYTSGASQTLGQVILGRFPNAQGLQKLGNTTWAQTSASGQAVEGLPGSNNMGSIQAGALESSNVDLAAQLVNLIIAQQSYQANAQTITTENQIVQTLLNIR